jgi:hypothetical protein
MSSSDLSPSKSDELPRELKAAAHAAEVSLVLVFLLTVATLSLNRAIVENWTSTDSRYRWYEDTGSMLARSRALRDHSPQLFEGLVLSVLMPSNPSDEWKKEFPNLAQLASLDVQITRLPHDGTIFNVRPHRINVDLFRELADAASSFGSRTAEILKMESEPNKRIPLLRTAVAQTFAHQEARIFLQREVIEALAYIDNLNQWSPHRRASWIVYGQWPPVMSGKISPPPGGSYGKRYFLAPDEDSEKRFVFRLVAGTTDPAQLNSTLENYWRDAFERLKNIPTGDRQIGIPGSAVALNVTDVVMLGGPVLVLVQAFFAIFWSRYFSTVSRAHEQPAASPFVFPVFSNPVDPLDGPMPKTVADITQRAVWLFSLMIPAIVLSLALLTRYDLSGVRLQRTDYGSELPMNTMHRGEWLPEKAPALARLSALREHDSLSIGLDALNMVALLASLLLMIEITTANRSITSRPRHRRLAIGCFLLWLVSLWLWAVRLDDFGPLLFRAVSPADLVYWLSFALVWLTGAFAAFSRGARLPFLTAVAGLFLIVVLAGPTP